MYKRLTLPIFIAILALAALALAAEWWEKKPYAQWNDKEVERMLDNSPWGKVHAVTIMPDTEPATRTFESTGGGDLEREKRNLFHLHFLSAKPVRMAIARQIMLATKEGVPDAAAIDRFVQQGDDKHIVISMTLSSVPKGLSSVRGYWSSLLNLSTTNLTANTALATKTGKRVYLVRYDKPGQDGMGAKYYFSRYMKDGSPLVTENDKEVRFETIVPLNESGTTREDRVWMQFDVRKMVFEGKLEI